MKAKELQKNDVIRLLDSSYHLIKNIEDTFVENGEQRMRIATISNAGDGEISYIYPRLNAEVERVNTNLNA